MDEGDEQAELAFFVLLVVDLDVEVLMQLVALLVYTELHVLLDYRVVLDIFC